MLSFDWLITQTCTYTVNCALLWVWLLLLGTLCKFCFEFQWLIDTLWVLLSSTILQTRPQLVTPLKGHSLSPCICPLTLLLSAPSERCQYPDKTVEASTFYKQGTSTIGIGLKKKSSILIQKIMVVFVLVQTAWAVIKEIPDLIFQLCVNCYELTAIWAPMKNCPLAEKFKPPKDKFFPFSSHFSSFLTILAFNC